jgi:protein SCO1/2
MSAPGSLRWRLAGLGLVSLGAAGLALGLTLLQMRNAPELPVYGAAPQFRLTERSGRSVTDQELRGSVWIADFIFTSCGGPCPLLSRRMAELHKRNANRPRLRLVSFTVDPDRDTPEVLRGYAERYGAGEGWWFLTGPKPEIFRLVREGFHLAAEMPDPASEQDILHSTRLVLVDPEGRIRGYYDGVGEEDRGRLDADLDRLLRSLS